MYQDDMAVIAHVLALRALRELQMLMALPLPPPRCEECPWGAAWCGKGCNGEPPELPELSPQR